MTQQQLRQATRDGIIMAIHVLWERGWKVTPESIQEMLKTGSHEECSLDKIEQVSKEVMAPGAKKQWLANFNWESEFAKANPRPWSIDSGTWKHQQIEND